MAGLCPGVDCGGGRGWGLLFAAAGVLVVDWRPGYRGDGDGGADGEEDRQVGGGVEAQESVAWKDGETEGRGIKEIGHMSPCGEKKVQRRSFSKLPTCAR